MPSNDSLEVRHNEARSQYEIERPEGLSVAQYRRDGQRIIFTHTEVPEALEGQGLASALVRHALDDARAQRLEVVPSCPYVATWIRRHDEYADLVAG